MRHIGLLLREGHRDSGRIRRIVDHDAALIINDLVHELVGPRDATRVQHRLVVVHLRRVPALHVEVVVR